MQLVNKLRRDLRAANGRVNVLVLSPGLRHLAAEEGRGATRSGLVGVTTELAVLKGVVVGLGGVVVPVEAKGSDDGGKDLHDCKHTGVNTGVEN